MGTTEHSLCPQCSEKGENNRVITVFYKSQNALYTCENKNCTYFVTDVTGNLVKFNKESNTTGYILDRPPQHETVDDELESFFDSLDSDYKDTSNNHSYPAQSTVQVPGNQSCENNSVDETKNENPNITDNLKVEQVFEMDCSSLNFEDFLYN